MSRKPRTQPQRTAAHTRTPVPQPAQQAGQAFILCRQRALNYDMRLLGIRDPYFHGHILAEGVFRYR